MMLAMVFPGSNNDEGIRFAFPTTMVTAIVSPNARENASRNPEKIPDLDAISLMSGDTDKKSTDRGITLNL